MCRIFHKIIEKANVHQFREHDIRHNLLTSGIFPLICFYEKSIIRLAFVKGVQLLKVSIFIIFASAVCVTISHISKEQGTKIITRD
jgi:hypothetical protein